MQQSILQKICSICRSLQSDLLFGLVVRYRSAACEWHGLLVFSKPMVVAYCTSGCLLTGFTHSAFAFGYESFVHKSKIDSNDVPPGALITFIQKGLQYLEMEANLGVEV